MRHQFEVAPRFYSAPEVVAAGNAAIGLWSLAGSWVASQRTPEPEPVPLDVLRRWERKPAPLAAKLVAVGLWAEPAATEWDDMAWAFLDHPTLYRFQAIRWRAPIDPALRERVYARDGYACVSCGATDRLSLDHIYPWSLGGADTYENFQTLCTGCNSSKGARV
jgi:hypothetical protein